MKLTIQLVALLFVAGFGLSSGAQSAFAADGQRLNILFIAVDDLRPQLGCYGHKDMRTPNLNRLAASGMVFDRHYVQVPTCGASRYAMMTSRRPRVGERWNNGAFGKLKRQRTAAPQTFPEFFHRNGYTTICIGKISHQPDGRIYAYSGKGSGAVEVPFAWDEVGAPYGKWKYGWSAFFGYANGLNRMTYAKASPVEAGNVADDGYPDGLIASAAVKKLQQLAKQKRPFLLAVGFYKPHLPFVAPKKYWDMYQRDKISLSPNPMKPTNIHKTSWHNSAESFGARYKSGKWARDKKTARLLRHGYFAAVSFVDAQIGRVLAALERLKLTDNTIVIVWGDHGWHLGDHGIWGKHTHFERSARSALIVRVPNMKQSGTKTAALVESIDLYPTLADVTGLPTPKGLAGVSLRPVLNNAKHRGKTAAFTYWRGGTSMRTDRFRLVMYPKGKTRYELYDHKTDPHETKNVAPNQERTVKRLLSHLKKNSPKMVADGK